MRPSPKIHFSPFARAGLRVAGTFLSMALVAISALSSPAAADLIDSQRGGVRFTEIIMPAAGSVVGPTHRVELTNFSSEAVDIGGWRLWYAYRRFYLPPGKVLAPGEVYLVHLGVDGVNDASNCYTGTKYGSLLTPSGWLALLGPVGDYYDPSVMMDFLQWGAPNWIVEPIAVAAGLWSEGVSLSCPIVPDVSLQACRDGFGPSAWDQEFETLGRVNRCAEGPVAVESMSWGGIKSLHR